MGSAKALASAPMGSGQQLVIQAIQLWPCHYRVKCTAAGCGNLARVIVRRIAEGGAPEGQQELCNQGARAVRHPMCSWQTAFRFGEK